MRQRGGWECTTPTLMRVSPIGFLMGGNRALMEGEGGRRGLTDGGTLPMLVR